MEEEETFAHLRARFAKRMRGDLARLEAELGPPSTCGDAARAEMARLAHGLAGAGGSFGYPEVSAQASRLDEALGDGDDAAADAARDDLIAVLRRDSS